MGSSHKGTCSFQSQIISIIKLKHLISTLWNQKEHLLDVQKFEELRKLMTSGYRLECTHSTIFFFKVLTSD
uniref:Uncharacterized protein n=1 Tax=Arundo donax TaxID=35708 RepID=A0A0A9BLY5_ARUDO